MPDATGQPKVERRLAAILAADVVGYSRLMGMDEEGTLSRLKAHRRELIDPKTAEYHGRMVKLTGDGALVEFPSIVGAVRCAVDIQRGMAEHNAELPEEKRIASVGQGFVASLAHPGGNITEVTIMTTNLGAAGLAVLHIVS
jgi:adenylate cyclase